MEMHFLPIIPREIAFIIFIGCFLVLRETLKNEEIGSENTEV